MAIFVVAIMVAASLAPMMFAFTDEQGADAASTAGIRDVSARVISSESEPLAFTSLVYLNEKLPNSVDPTQWVRDDPARGGTGFWYNINQMSADYGKFLTYANTGMPISQIKEDILAYFQNSGTPIFTSEFQFIQIDFRIDYISNFNVTIVKDAVTLCDKDYYERPYASGAVMSSMKQCLLYSIDTTAGDLKPTTVRGDYEISCKCEKKVEVYNRTISYSESDVRLYGAVYDNNDNLAGGSHNIVYNAKISYDLLNEDGTTYKTGLVTTISPVDSGYAKQGKFMITLPRGYLAKVTNVDAAGYSFAPNQKTFTSQPVTADTDDVDIEPAPGTQRKSPVFTANEFSVTVQVKDAAAAGLPNIALDAVWYYKVLGSDNSVYYLEPPFPSITPGTVSFASNTTDANGEIVLTYTVPSSYTDVEPKLYVKALDNDAYSFEYDVMPEIGVPEQKEYPSLTKQGNIYIDTGTAGANPLRSVESSFTVNVSGLQDAGGYGGAPIEDVALTAVWLYETADVSTGKRKITDNTEGLAVWTPGIAAVASNTDLLGNAVVSYRLPDYDDTSVTAYLYINSTSTIFTMAGKETKDVIGTFDQSLPDLITGLGGCQAVPTVAVGNPVYLTSVEISYSVHWTVTGEVSGDVPSSMTVSYFDSSWKASRNHTVYPDAGKIEFDVIVRAGDSPKVTMTSSTHKILPQSVVMVGSVNTDLARESTAAKIVEPSVPRSEVVGIDSPYVVTGLSLGDIITYSYMVGADQYVVDVKAKDNGSGSIEASLQIMGWVGQSIREGSLSVDSTSDIFISPFEGNVATASPLLQKRIVAYYDDGPSPEPLSGVNTIKDKTITIQYNGKFYQDVSVDSKGEALIKIPDGAGVTFWYENKQLEMVEMTTGAYNGYYSFNFFGYISIDDGLTYVTVTLKYVASSVDSATEKALIGPQVKKVNIGNTAEFTAPTIEGYTFSAWLFDGVDITSKTKQNTCLFEADKSMDENVTLVAVYGATTVTTPTPGVDNTVIAIGLGSIVIALLAFVYVVFQSRRY